MGFRQGSYATVWEVKPVSNTFTNVRLSITRKPKDSDTYETEFSGYVAFAGTLAAQKAAKLQPRDRIILGECDVKTKYDADKKITYYNFSCFSFEIPEPGQRQGGKTKQAPKKQSAEELPEVDNGELDDSKLPF